MSNNVSIFEKKWLDLVFEGKNQEYGAYKLRQESSKITLFAFLFGISFLLLGTFVLSSFATKESLVIPNDSPIIVHVSTYKQPETPKAKAVAPIIQKTPITVPKSPIYVVAKQDQAQQDDTKKTEPTATNIISGATPGGTTPGITPTVGGSDGGGDPIVEPKKPTITILNPTELDKQPMFPGGIKSFYKYVGDNFEKQSGDEGESMRVMVSFIIEKNGEMSNIKILQKTNSDEVDAEAVRVLKSLKTKWSPGFKDGEAVRTQFILPITVVM